MTELNLKPTKNTLYVERWLGLNFPTDVAAFEVTNKASESHTIHVSKNMRRVLEGLMEQPLYCASRCRIGHYVDLLRKEQHVDIETDWYSSDPETNRMRYGVYRIVSEVTRIDRAEAA